MTPRAVVLAVLVPGLGHAALGKRARGLAFFLIVGLAFAGGLALKGRLYLPDPDHPLTILASLTMLGTGLLNIAARLAGYGAGDIRAATHEYGTTYLLTAGVMNLLLVLDVLDRAGERKR